ncbi:MAG: M4 family metallopeptidase [Clostridia bacterium]|nr:M4 family metallopeptidase [Clostridia bacterium]
MKKALSVVLALVMLLCQIPLAGLSEEAPGEPVCYIHDDRVTLIDGACTRETIETMEDASAVIREVIGRLGGDGETELEPWRVLTDAFGNRYFVFRQMHEHMTVLGGAVKVITDKSGTMIGLTSSIVSDLPEGTADAGVSAKAAEELVLRLRQAAGDACTVLDGMTSQMILPVILDVDMEAGDDEEKSRYVWVVYTTNPKRSGRTSSDLPYLAHYVTLSGEYLYSLPTLVPGDEAGTSGFDAGYVFEFMEDAEYTGYVDPSVGGEKEVSVHVMRDRRTGMYYLGDLERRIVVADCYEFLYNHGQVVLEYSPDNLEWDQNALLTFYNYCRAYDYYKAIGWSGGDGMETPILVLNDYCDQNHTPVDNAAYVGNYLGWQIFLASRANDFAQCLDVLAHEYTHCVTSSVMTYNAYVNDFGAINEAISDIQGKTCQMLTEGRDGTTWEIADRSLESIRSLSDPHAFHQPEFTLDLYYTPAVRTPTALNDAGGVHTNSSLLNYLAWCLYEKGGMTLEEGRSFWFTVDCAMTPGTDYAQLSEILPWALRAAGMTQYERELQRAMDATRLGVEALPEVFDEDRTLLSLELPEREVFGDDQWLLFVLSVNVEEMAATVKGMISRAADGDWSFLPDILRPDAETDEPEIPEDDETEEEKGFWEGLLDALLTGWEEEEVTGGIPEKAADEKRDDVTLDDSLREELLRWYREHFRRSVYTGTTNAGQDGRHMRMMSRPGYGIPVLFHGIFQEETSRLEDVKVLIFLGGSWIDMGAILEDMISSENGPGREVEEMISSAIDRIGENLGQALENGDLLSAFLYKMDGGVQNVIPSEGLSDMQPATLTVFDQMQEEQLTAQAVPERRMSRPKLPDPGIEESQAEKTPEEESLELEDGA